jgi:hypothetical protein
MRKLIESTLVSLDGFDAFVMGPARTSSSASAGWATAR